MTFNQKLSAYTLGFLTDKDLPDIGITGLEEGFDSESLCILAGCSSNENSFVLVNYFSKAVKELNLDIKTRKEALVDVVSFHIQISLTKGLIPILNLIP